MALWQVKTEIPEAWGTNSHFPLPLCTPLRSKRSTLSVLSCPWPGERDQIKQTRISKLEYLMRTKETTPTRRSRVEAAQRAGTRLARLIFFLFFLLFFNTHNWKQNFYFNKIVLSSLLCCFILQSNYREPIQTVSVFVQNVKKCMGKLKSVNYSKLFSSNVHVKAQT